MQALSCNLTDCFLCQSCIPEWKEVVALRKTTIPIKKGRPIFREGEKVEGMFFIYSGFAKVHKQWLPQKELILRFAAPGDILGHRGLGGVDSYPVSATALEDTKLCYISHEFLETTLKANPSLTYKLMHFYAAELQRAEQRMRDLLHREVKGRIAGALLEIASFFGTNEDKYIAVTITRQDIASYAGTTYETVFKVFTDFIAAKIITTSGKDICINDPAHLRRYIHAE